MTAKVELLDFERARSRALIWPDVYFEPGYGLAEEAAGRGTWRCIIGGAGEWLMPFLTNGDELARDASSPYGYSGIYAAAHLSPTQRAAYWEATLTALREAGLVSLFVRQSPLFPAPFGHQPGPAVVSGHETYAVPLGHADDMWAAMEGRGRTSIRKAQRDGFTGSIRAATLDDLLPDAPFRTLYLHTMERRLANSRYHFPDRYYTYLVHNLAERLLLAEVTDPHGAVAASALFMTNGPLMHYHLSAGTPTAGRAGATNLLIWTAALHGAAHGCRRLHLGGGLANGDGLARFKRSFGGNVLSYSAFGVIVDEQLYKTAMAARGLGAESSTDTFFPPYRSSDVTL